MISIISQIDAGMMLVIVLGAVISCAVYPLSIEAGQKWKEDSWLMLAMNVLFYGLGGYGFAAVAITGLINSNEVNYQEVLLIFAILTIPSTYGLWKGITHDYVK